MMSYLTRPGFNGGGSVRNKTVLPKRKPKAEIKRRQKINYEKIKQYLEDESQEFIERELGFAFGGRVNPAQLKQRFMQLVASIQDAEAEEIPGIVAQAKQIKDQIDEINLTLSPDRQIKITAQGIDFDNPLLDAAKIAQTVDTTQEVTGGLTKDIVKDIVPESLTTGNPIYKGQPTPVFPKGTKGTLADEEEKQDPKIDRRAGIDPRGNVVQASMKMGRRTDKNIMDYLRRRDLFRSIDPTITETEGSFAEGGDVDTPKRGLVDEPGSYAGRKERTKADLRRMRLDGMTIPEIAKKYKVSVKTINNDLKKFNLLGMQTFVEPMTEKRAEEIRRTLPEGLTLRREKAPKTKAGYAYRLDGRITKDKKLVYNKSLLNPTEKTIKEFSKEYSKVFKEVNAGYISPTEFEKLRFRKENVNLTDREFAEVLNSQGRKTSKRSPFTKKSVANMQQRLDIRDQVGKEVKPLSKDLQNRLIKNFPEITDWDFDSYKYGVSPTEYGQDFVSTLRHSTDDKKRWNPGQSPKSRLWHNAFRSSIKDKGQNRYRLLNDKGEIMTRAEIMDTNWSTKSKQAKFLDTATGIEFTYDTFEDYLNNHAGPKDPNRFARSALKYKISKDLYNLKVKGPDGNEARLGTLLNEKYKGDRKRFKAVHNHHNFDIAENFWDTDVVFYKDNMGIKPLEKNLYQELKAASLLEEGEKNKVLKNLSQQLDNVGPIRLTTPGAEIGKYNLESALTNISKQADVLDNLMLKLPKKTQQEICRLLGAKKLGGSAVSCPVAMRQNPTETLNIIEQETKKLPKQAGDQVLKAANKIRQGLKVTGLGFLTEVPFELAAGVNPFKRGKPVDEIVDESIIGLYGMGRDLNRPNVEEFVNTTQRSGALKFYDYYKDQARLKEIDTTLRRLSVDQPDADTSDLLQEKQLIEGRLGTEPTGQDSEDFSIFLRRRAGEFEANKKARGQYGPFTNIIQGTTPQSFSDAAEELNINLGGMLGDLVLPERENIVPTTTRAQRRDRDFMRQRAEGIKQLEQNILFPATGSSFAGGGIAKLAGKSSGIPPTSGPTPDGPSEGLAFFKKNGSKR